MHDTRAIRKTRLLVVEDHAVTRAAFAQMVETTGDFELIGEAGTASAAIALVRGQAVDVVLLDVSLPDATVLDTMQTLRGAQPDIAILIVSMHPEEQYAANLISAGADGYFAKGQDAGEFRKAIRTVARGDRYMSPAVSAALSSRGNDIPLSPRELLTPREYEVFLQLAAGKSLTEIADDMFVPLQALNEYLARILEKTNLASITDLITYSGHVGVPVG